MIRVARCVGAEAIFSSSSSAFSNRVQMPSRLSTPRPPSSLTRTAVSGLTTPSIAEARSGRSKR
jgi:hypothetical protein